MNNEIFFNLSFEKISIFIFDKYKKNEIFNKNLILEKTTFKDTELLKKIDNILKNQILEMEKNINIPVSKVNLMIDDPSILTINISTNKNYDNKQLQKTR